MLKKFVFSLAAIVVLALWLAWISTGFEALQGWTGFLGVILLGTALLFGGWKIFKMDFQRFGQAESSTSVSQWSIPSWLAGLLIGAALLRLGAGALWYVTLPEWGYGGEAESGGYVMGDAFERDVAAWDLAASPWPLTAAFLEFKGDDQYGGFLFGSALIYRYLGGSSHQPLQIVVLTSAFSSLAVLFTWGFARHVWNVRIAGVAAWIVALFPDAVLLGSSQMREALLMTLVMMAFYGLARTWRQRSWSGILWMVLPLFVCLPLQPLVAVMLGGIMGLFALFLGNLQWLKDWRLWAVLIGLVVAGLVVITLFGEKILPGNHSNPIALLRIWLKQAARLQAINSEQASGWMQKVFRSTPEWAHAWFLLSYGVVRPFLPASLFDNTSAAIWQGIAIWRSFGWTLLLPFLMIAPLISWWRAGFRNPVMGLSLIVWIGILIASFRGGADQFDNPRYRVVWIGLQAVVVAWVWITQKQEHSPWIRRGLISIGLVMVWWLPWYMGRMTSFNWPIRDVFALLALGFASAGLYLILEIWLTKHRNNKIDL